MFELPEISDEFRNWVLLPLLIFFARLTDVTLGTLRIVFVSKGRKKIAPILGFVEVLIWLAAIGQVMQNLNNVVCYIAWAGGFASGNLMGILIEERLALGLQVIRVITADRKGDLARLLNAKGFGITRVDAQGSMGQVELIFSIIRRKDLPLAIEVIRKADPEAFYTVEDIRAASETVFSPGQIGKQTDLFSRLFPIRKAK
ncbi:MAG: DUF2179 domain-containing protein [Sphingobacteriia bacterium]|jgi:uncharacterized protein YebE (UPF0316 family)|nr:DUF2179 domain-containing protein [Sphingobacteriia bacterium]